MAQVVQVTIRSVITILFVFQLTLIYLQVGLHTFRSYDGIADLFFLFYVLIPTILAVPLVFLSIRSIYAYAKGDYSAIWLEIRSSSHDRLHIVIREVTLFLFLLLQVAAVLMSWSFLS